MSIEQLPNDPKIWYPYFDKTLDLIDDIIPRIAFGLHKIKLIVDNLKKFEDNFKKKINYLNDMKKEFVYKFFVTCNQFIVFCSEYIEKNFINYFLKYSINQQFDDLYLLWKEWSNQSFMLLFDCFLNYSDLYLANELDLKDISNAIKAELNIFPISITNALKFKLDNIDLVFRKFNKNVDDKFPGIVQHDQIETSNIIGSGAYAVVMHGKIKNSNEDLAIKELKNVNFSPRNALSLKRELDALLKLDHPNVLKFIGITVTPPFRILTKYIGNGSLFDNIHSENKKLDNLTKLKIATGMARGLEYLSKKRFIHRDFKSQNVLLDYDYNPIICDFGISRTIGINMTCELGTIQWTAPEVLVQSSEPYGFAADTYSFGIVLWELLTEKIPYQGLRTAKIAFMVYVKDMRPPISVDAPIGIATLIDKCLKKKPRNRPSMSKIREMLENGEIFFGETDMKKFKEWVLETRPKHLEIMNQVDKLSEEKKNDILNKVFSIRTLDSNNVKILQQLFQIDYLISKELFLHLIYLIENNYSSNYQNNIFNLLKQMLMKPELVNIIPIELIIEKIDVLIQIRPNMGIISIKIISDRIPDAKKAIDHFLSLPQSYGTIECIKAIIEENKNNLSPSFCCEVYMKLKGVYSIGFFIFMINTYELVNEFEEISCCSLFLMKIYLKKLSKMTDVNDTKVREILDIQEFMTEPKSSLKRTIDNVSSAITKNSCNITEKMGNLIYKYLIKNCLKYKQLNSIVPLIYMLSKLDTMKSLIFNSFFLDIIIQSFTSIHQTFGLKLIRNLTIFDDKELLNKIWKILIDIFNENKTKELAITISYFLTREPKLDHSKLDNIIINSILDDEISCLLDVKIVLSYNKESLKIFDDKLFISNLIHLIWRKNTKISKSIGKLCNHIAEVSPNIINIPDLYIKILNYLYEPDTPFVVAKQFIKFFGNVISNKNVLYLLKRNYFSDYIEQIPWIYNDSEIFSSIEDFKMKLTAATSSL